MALPTKEELAELPHRAIVAYAVRCARRLQPQFHLPNHVPKRLQHLLVVDKANQVGESFARGEASAEFARAAATAFDTWDQFETFDIGLTQGADDKKIRAARRAANSAARAAASRAAAAHAADDAAFAAYIAYTGAFAAGQHAVAADADYQRLVKLATIDEATADFTIDPTEDGPLGPLWPKGAPDWYEPARKRMLKELAAARDKEHVDIDPAPKSRPDDDPQAAAVNTTDQFTAEIDGTGPQPQISVYFDDAELTDEEKLLFLEYLSEIYRDHGDGMGLKIVDGQTKLPEHAGNCS